MKQFMKILAVILAVWIVLMVTVGCGQKPQDATDTSTTEQTEDTTEKEKITKKQFVPTVPTEDTTEPDTTEEPVPEETGPIELESDSETGFSGALDMH